MAKITLPTNYRDDILNPSADGKRKYIMSYNQDGTVSFEDVTPYEQVGSDYGAGDINTANEAINESFDKNKLVKDLDTINALTEEGFAPDALAVKQLNDSLFKKGVLNTRIGGNPNGFTEELLPNDKLIVGLFCNTKSCYARIVVSDDGKYLVPQVLNYNNTAPAQYTSVTITYFYMDN